MARVTAWRVVITSPTSGEQQSTDSGSWVRATGRRRGGRHRNPGRRGGGDRDHDGPARHDVLLQLLVNATAAVAVLAVLIAVLIALLSPVSGAHLNPAVTR
ncbi:MAG: hypothetical protein WCG47_31075 [Dermatophilaceae bacterium]